MIVTKFRSSIRTSIAKNCAHTKYYRALLVENTIEGQGKDLATRGTARGLVSLSTYRSPLAC